MRSCSVVRQAAVAGEEKRICTYCRARLAVPSCLNVRLPLITLGDGFSVQEALAGQFARREGTVWGLAVAQALWLCPGGSAGDRVCRRCGHAGPGAGRVAGGTALLGDFVPLSGLGSSRALPGAVKGIKPWCHREGPARGHCTVCMFLPWELFSLSPLSFLPLM